MTNSKDQLSTLARSLALAMATCLLAACYDGAAPTASAMALNPGNPEIESLRTQSAYTDHSASVGNAEVLPIRIGPGFELGERAKILRAVNEWNHSLNGVIRLAIADDPTSVPMMAAAGNPFGRVWTIAPLRGAQPMRGQLTGHALAVTQPLPAGGGIVVVHIDRLGNRDLGAVMRHEIGHMLGLGHEAGSRLMSAYYASDDQRCIDRATIAALAASRKRPLSSFNWCD